MTRPEAADFVSSCPAVTDCPHDWEGVSERVTAVLTEKEIVAVYNLVHD